MVRKSISLPDDVYLEIKRIAKAERKTFSAIIREAIDLVIMKYKR